MLSPILKDLNREPFGYSLPIDIFGGHHRIFQGIGGRFPSNNIVVQQVAQHAEN
jgi:hypothetical protein